MKQSQPDYSLQLVIRGPSRPPAVLLLQQQLERSWRYDASPASPAQSPGMK